MTVVGKYSGHLLYFHAPTQMKTSLIRYNYERYVDKKKIKMQYLPNITKIKYIIKIYKDKDEDSSFTTTLFIQLYVIVYSLVEKSCITASHP